MFTTLEIWMHK